MSADFFEQLESELGQRTRDGAHLTGPSRARHRRARWMCRAAAGGLSAVVLAVSLAAEFPATASGHIRRAGAARVTVL